MVALEINVKKIWQRISMEVHRRGGNDRSTKKKTDADGFLTGPFGGTVGCGIYVRQENDRPSFLETMIMLLP